MSLRTLLAAVAVLATAALPAFAVEPGSIHAIVNVDIIPEDQVAGAKMMADYVQQARQDRDLLSVALIRQAGSTNHFVLDEIFADRAAYDRHVSAAYVRRFRAALYPLLGSPWDERLGTDLNL